VDSSGTLPVLARPHQPALWGATGGVDG
jgi:hypothetical protein